MAPRRRPRLSAKAQTVGLRGQRRPAVFPPRQRPVNLPARCVSAVYPLAPYQWVLREVDADAVRVHRSSPTTPSSATLALTRQAEAAGFAYGWLFDSHVLWRDPYPLLTLMAGATESAAAGHVRDRPRDPRAVRHRLPARHPRRGVRRADGSRHRTRRLGPARPRQGAHHDGRHRDRPSGPSGRLVAGEHDRLRGHGPCTSRGPGGWTLPVWVAGYGPLALAMTRRVADGVILQLADPDLIRLVRGPGPRAPRSAAGRDPASIRVQAAAPAHVGPRELGRERTQLVPGPRLQPRGRPRQQVPARPAARRP